MGGLCTRWGLKQRRLHDQPLSRPRPGWYGHIGASLRRQVIAVLPIVDVGAGLDAAPTALQRQLVLRAKHSFLDQQLGRFLDERVAELMRPCLLLMLLPPSSVLVMTSSRCASEAAPVVLAKADAVSSLGRPKHFILRRIFKYRS